VNLWINDPDRVRALDRTTILNKLS